MCHLRQPAVHIVAYALLLEVIMNNQKEKEMAWQKYWETLIGQCYAEAASQEDFVAITKDNQTSPDVKG